MTLNKSTGNMYDWVTHTWPCVHGECPHQCSYCYVKAQSKRFPNSAKAYSGIPRFVGENDKLGEGRTIFVANTNDLFADSVPALVINRVIQKINENPDNFYIIQTKNPRRLLNWIQYFKEPNLIVGTTIETDRFVDLEKLSRAPHPMDRASAMLDIRLHGKARSTFITIEPIMDFYLDDLVRLIETAWPSWVNIGADSKNNGLKEPTWEQVQDLIGAMNLIGVEVREKSNLERLKAVTK